jgi:hypothetical protein
MAAVRDDAKRLVELVRRTNRVLTTDEARTLTGYMRALNDAARDRRIAAREKFGDKTMEELLEEAKKIPELREMLGGDE